MIFTLKWNIISFPLFLLNWIIIQFENKLDFCILTKENKSFPLILGSNDLLSSSGWSRSIISCFSCRHRSIVGYYPLQFSFYFSVMFLLNSCVLLYFFGVKYVFIIFFSGYQIINIFLLTKKIIFFLLNYHKTACCFDHAFLVFTISVERIKRSPYDYEPPRYARRETVDAPHVTRMHIPCSIFHV